MGEGLVCGYDSHSLIVERDGATSHSSIKLVNGEDGMG
jgi:hypothetical protein